MKNDSRSCSSAQVDTVNARFGRSKDLGIAFTNEIDVWTQIEFKARHQIRHLRQFGTHKSLVLASRSDSFFYSTPQRLENL